MSYEVPCCPDCGQANPYHRRPSVQGFDHAHEWRCENAACKARFDDPEWRTPKTGDCIPGNTVAAMLDKMDPDEVGP